MTGKRNAAGPPLYQRVKQSLLEAIARGEYTSGAPFITERKVCDEFGVSSTTAVRALNELVTEGVLIRRQGRGTFVAEHASPDPAGAGATATSTPGAGRATADGRHHEGTIACILQSHGPHVFQLLSGVESSCAELGYRMYLTHCEESPEREGEALRAALASNVSGIVLYPAEGSGNSEVFAEIRRRGVPLVLVDRYRPDLVTDAVVADNLAVGYEVTEQLIRLGHQRIATLWGETDCTSVRDRLAGHLQALRDHDLPVRPELTVLRSYGHGSGASRPGVATLLESSDAPSVLLCANGHVLAKVLHDLVRLGVDVPDRVDLAGMDDAGPLEILPLAAVAAHLPSQEMGREAARLLHTRITSADPYQDVRHVVLPISVHTRHQAPGHLRVVVADEQALPTDR